MNPVSLETIELLIPELLLAATALGIFLGGAFLGPRALWSWIAQAGLLLAGGHILWHHILSETPQHGVFGPVGSDGFSDVLRCAAVLVGLLFVCLAMRRGQEGPSPEATGSMLLVIAGLMIVSCAEELVMLFLGLELISIPTYLLLFLGRNEAEGGQPDTGLRDVGTYEASSKYFFLSVLSSAILLYGFSFLYGLTGELRLDGIAEGLATNEVGGPLPVLALLLVMAGLGFKIAAVPFHFYAPDVYQGTTNLNAGLLSVIPKIAGVVVLIRLVAAVLPPDMAQFGWQLVLVLSVLTMTLGNVAALWQNNIRRMLAYSSIAHAGYMLIGLCAFLAARSSQAGGSEIVSVVGLPSLLLYLAVYVAASLGTFAAIIHLGQREQPIDRIEQLAGLGRSRPLIGLALAVFMFSLAGIPPLAGFWGKLGLFYAALQIEATTDLTIAGVPMRVAMIALAAIGAMNAAIAAAYYLRVVSTIYFRPSADSSHGLASVSLRRTPGAAFVMGACMLIVIALGCQPGWLVHLSRTTATAAIKGSSAVSTPDVSQQAQLTHDSADR